MSERETDDLSAGPNLSRERKTLLAMLRIFCRGNHGGRRSLCSECEQLRDYAMQRLARCPFGEEKPVCSKCPIHCYGAEMRERVRHLMRYAGPRMLLRHPVLALRHLLDQTKAPPSGKKFDKRGRKGQNDNRLLRPEGPKADSGSSSSDCSHCTSSLREGCHVTQP